VFNLELPTDAATYAHRAGRTGRFGRPGLMVSVVEPQVDTRSESGQRVETRAGVASSSQRFGRPGLMVSVVEPQVDTRSESGQRVETRAGVASSSQRGPTRLHASTAAGYVLDNTQSGSHPSRS
jgi:superfamily II DNA/RNA helicase